MAVLNNYQKIIPFIIFTFALIFLFKLVRPMVTVLLSSVLLSYLTFPLYKKIGRKIKNKPTSIILSLLTVALIILIPFSFLSYGAAQQGIEFYKYMSDKIANGSLLGLCPDEATSRLCAQIERAEQFSFQSLEDFGIEFKIETFLPMIQNIALKIAASIPIMLAEISLTIIISYFILKDHENITRNALNFLPMRKKTVNRLLEDFSNITHTVVYAQLLVALVQGIIGTIGFYIFGIPFPILFGILIAFCALIPTIGTAMIWAPASIFLIFSGYLSGDTSALLRGLGLLLYGIFIISVIDNILLAKIVHAKAQVNPIIIIVGVIGGAAMFGLMGIFLGPIILPLLLTYINSFEERSEISVLKPLPIHRRQNKN
ncbi:MAG TPA: AI-2E family transporter [Alphaproteobacteria bacterium]|nr:AI-2E family transporter [Alphaproteobacteria bacterium]